MISVEAVWRFIRQHTALVVWEGLLFVLLARAVGVRLRVAWQEWRGTVGAVFSVKRGDSSVQAFKFAWVALVGISVPIVSASGLAGEVKGWIHLANVTAATYLAFINEWSRNRIVRLYLWAKNREA